jgi:carboxymethylenebutenolidase
MIPPASDPTPRRRYHPSDQMRTGEIEPGVLKGGAYLALPDSPGPHPGVVVIHEAYGLNENIKDIAGRFAGQGYAALAVDLFAGRNRAICMTRYMAGMLRGSVDRFGISDLKAALTHLAAMPEVDPERIGAIGFCMGGGFAVAWACTDRRLKAIAPFYGANPRPLEAVKRACPVVGSYPEKDFTAGAGRALDLALDTAGIVHDIKIYPGAGHSFFNDRGRAYNKPAADDSWNRVLSFFGEHLAPKS